MSHHARKQDIQIGQGRWITTKNIGMRGRHIEIDSILDPIMPLLEALESNCVASCCGISAFYFGPEDIEKAMSSMNKKKCEILRDNLISIQDEIKRLPEGAIVSSRMNYVSRKSVYLELLKHIEGVVESVRAKSTDS